MFFFFLLSFKLDVFDICWKYKHTCSWRIQMDILCIYINIQIQWCLNIDFSVKVADKGWCLFACGLAWPLEVQLCYWLLSASLFISGKFNWELVK